ncbi:MAG: SUMF1/EgtB/PvdO family nonheme iron enzyme [Candidatus Methylumidiphilus sp.]
MPATAPANPPLHLKVFIGSPGDVNDERQLALKLLNQLPYDGLLDHRVTFEAVMWDHPQGGATMLGGLSAQDSVTWAKGPPADCDIVVICLWSRLGSPITQPGYAKADGGYYTGTEWEYDNAVQAFIASGKQQPVVLLYHRTEEPISKVSPKEKQAYLDRVANMEQVENFLQACRARSGEIPNDYQGASDFQAKLERDIKGIVRRRLDALAPAPTRTDSVSSIPPFAKGGLGGISPFPGLRPFTHKDWPIFFGRGKETDELLARLRDPAQRFIAVVGASGSGKSSLVWAGLIPRLLDGALEGSADWAWVRFTPGQLGDNPFITLANCWKDTLEANGKSLCDYAETLQQTPECLDGLLQIALANRPASAELLVFIDQFEELFTLVKPDYRPAFVRFMLALSNSARIRLVMSVRADFYAQCVEQGLAEALRTGSYPLAAPGPGALYQMVTRPAALGGLAFEDGLDEAILTDAGSEPGALPLLAFALEQLHQARTAEGLLTHTAYQAFGKVQGAIGQQADAIFAKLPAEVQAKFTEVFRELIEVDERGVPTRRRAKLSEVSHSRQSQQLIDALTKARLLVSDTEKSDEITVVGRNKPAPAGVSGMTTGQKPETVASRPYSGLLQNDNSTASNDANNHTATVEVAHEALFRSWGKLADWVKQTADDHRLRRQIGQMAAYWEDHERKDEHRWSDERVVEVAQMLEHLGLSIGQFSEPQQAFLGPVNAVAMRQAIDSPATSHELRAMIGVRLDRLGDTRKGVGLREDGLPDMDWVAIPGGTVTIEIRADVRDSNSKITNTLTREVGALQIARYPVTLAQFQAFVRECHDGKRWRLPPGLPFNLPDGYAPPKHRARHGNHPADTVSWYDAVSFCHWLSVRLGYPVRLPTEFEWQLAAIGGGETHSRPSHGKTGLFGGWPFAKKPPESNHESLPPLQNYPWGQDWNPALEPWRANSYESDLGRSTAVGMYPGGASALGVLDLSGTVWEWCQNTYENPDDVAVSTAGSGRVLRGGSWSNFARSCRSACRSGIPPDDRGDSAGFRCARVQA